MLCIFCLNGNLKILDVFSQFDSYMFYIGNQKSMAQIGYKKILLPKTSKTLRRFLKIFFENVEALFDVDCIPRRRERYWPFSSSLILVHQIFASMLLRRFCFYHIVVIDMVKFFFLFFQNHRCLHPVIEMVKIFFL